MSMMRSLVDENHSLSDVAMLIRRAGVEHLIHNVDVEELEALARAGSEIELKRAAALAKALLNPVAALTKFDGGDAARAQAKAMAYAASEVRRVS